MEEEVWKPIEGFEDRYLISSFGRVKSLRYNRTNKERILRDGDTRGYRFVILVKDKNKRVALVHRLVAEAFIPNPNNLPCIDHIDGNKVNNNVSNLRWVTYKENSQNPITKKRQVENMKGSHICCWRGHFGKEHPKSKRVGQYSLDGVLIKEFCSTMDAERELGIRHSYISDCCRGNISYTKGFIFKYL